MSEYKDDNPQLSYALRVAWMLFRTMDRYLSNGDPRHSVAQELAELMPYLRDDQRAQQTAILWKCRWSREPSLIQGWEALFMQDIVAAVEVLDRDADGADYILEISRYPLAATVMVAHLRVQLSTMNQHTDNYKFLKTVESLHRLAVAPGLCKSTEQQ